MSTEQPDPSDMAREALEQEVRDRRQQPEMEFRGEKKVENLWIGGLPVGRKIMGNGEKADEAIDLALEDKHVDVDRDAAREQKLKIHRRLTDLHLGDGDEMNKSTRRGAWLFQKFIHKFDPDENLTGVEGGHGRLRMGSTRAKDVLQENGIEDPSSNDVKRAMKAVVKRSEHPESGEQMFAFKSGRPYTLSVDKNAFEAYLEGVQEEIRSTVATGADDGGNSPEASPDASSIHDEFARLEQAHPDGGEEKTDTVVSSSRETLSEEGDESTR